MPTKHLTIGEAIFFCIPIITLVTGVCIGSAWERQMGPKETPEEVARKVEMFFYGQQLSYQECGHCHDEAVWGKQ